MSSKVVVIVNSGSGSVSGEQTLDELRELFNESGIEANVAVATNSDNLKSLAETTARSDSTIVIAGGGDGTISTVASALMGTEKILGILPLGTLNNFSKDLRIPQELASAIGTIADGFTQEID